MSGSPCDARLYCGMATKRPSRSIPFALAVAATVLCSVYVGSYSCLRLTGKLRWFYQRVSHCPPEYFIGTDLGASGAGVRDIMLTGYWLPIELETRARRHLTGESWVHHDIWVESLFWFSATWTPSW
jgi:hypothetical protein